MEWWQQPPVIEEHEGILVAREDLVEGGAKMRFLPHLVAGADHLVFGGPFCGGAPYALSVWGKRKKVRVTLFFAKRGQLHARQRAEMGNGAYLVSVPFGRMSNVQKKARSFAQLHGARFLPLGFDLPEASEPFVTHLQGLQRQVGSVDQVWCATGSGMLARCLGLAFPKAEICAVAVGLRSRSAKQAFPPNVEVIDAGVPFEEESEAECPFPSDPNYDRKAWAFCRRRSEGRALFFNVMGPA